MIVVQRDDGKGDGDDLWDGWDDALGERGDERHFQRSAGVFATGGQVEHHMVAVSPPSEGVVFGAAELSDSGGRVVGASRQVTVCDSALDATGGEYKVNYKGAIGRVVEDTVAAFIDVGEGERTDGRSDTRTCARPFSARY